MKTIYRHVQRLRQHDNVKQKVKKAKKSLVRETQGLTLQNLCCSAHTSLGLGLDFSWRTYKHMNERERKLSEQYQLKELYKWYVEQHASNGLGPNSYFYLAYIHNLGQVTEVPNKLVFGPFKLSFVSKRPLAQSFMSIGVHHSN